MKKKNQNKKVKEITKDMSFAEIIEKFPEAIEILLGSGMHCIGCPMAMQETLEAGARAHGIDIEDLIKKINERIKKNANVDDFTKKIM